MRPRFFPPIPQPKKKPILIRVTKDDDNLVSWEEYSDRGGLQRSLYKLHIKIAIRDQQQYCDEIKLLLDEAVEVGTLWGYKYVSSTPEFMHQKLNEATRIGTSQNQLDLQRTYNNPYVLYISIYPNPEKITALCQQIERVLKKTSSEKIALSAVDLPLYPHISFRQEQFNGRCERHIPSHHAKPDTLERLKDTTLKSLIRGFKQTNTISQKVYKRRIIAHNNRNYSLIYPRHRNHRRYYLFFWSSYCSKRNHR